MSKFLLVNFAIVFVFSKTAAQPIEISMKETKHENKIIEIRSYNLKPGVRDDFQKLFVEHSLPLLKKWKINVVAYGPSWLADSSWFLIRAYKDTLDRQQTEDAFYGSDDWRKGPREAVLAMITNFTTVVLPSDSLINWSTKIKNMQNEKSDRAMLSKLNAQFINNFIKQDVPSHDKIIHKDFVCIENNGKVVQREEYLKDWATSYIKSGYTSFSYTDELIRIFGNTALVRSKTVYTKKIEGKEIKGNSIYTDTYVKENGKWLCVQAQITPVK
jgi:hypothetical protein